MKGTPDYAIDLPQKKEFETGELRDTRLLSIRGTRTSRLLWIATGVLISIHILGILLIDVAGSENIWTLRFFHIFHLDREQNLAAGFSSFLLFFAGMLLALITYFKWNLVSSFRYLWALLSAGFFLMAVDEAWSFHERLVKPIRVLTDNDLPAIFHFAWVLPAVVILLALAVLFLKFVVDLAAETRTSFLLAAFLYLGGAVGMEMLGGVYAASEGQHTVEYVLLTTVEESLEICGVLIFIGSLFRYIRKNFRSLKITFSRDTPAQVG